MKTIETLQGVVHGKPGMCVVAAVLLRAARSAMAQPGGQDLSRVRVLRDIEYVPGRFKDPQVDRLVTGFFKKRLQDGGAPKPRR